MAGRVRAPDDALELLRGLPGGARALDAVAATPGAWLIGGAVRDALLGREPGELDVALEGPVGPRAFAAELGVELEEEHDRFGTGTLLLPEGLRVDLARTRTETYAHPGALPTVAPATLAEDLARRDATINAIALRPMHQTKVFRSEPGPGVDSVGGALEDLEAGVVRVLHERSFADDATRLWRIARYASRLGFVVAPATAALAAAADVETVSGPRHANELRRTLAEPDPQAALAATQTLAPALFPAGFAPADASGAVALLAGSTRADVRLAVAGRPGDAGRADLLWLARACEGVGAAALTAWLDRLGLTAHERDVVGAGSRAVVREPLRAARRPSEVARAARGAPVEVVALAGGPNARAWLDELRHVALAITGADLIAAGIAPGPELGRRLQAALDARLDGTAPTASEQLAAALA